jgi:hypothetical protein
VLDYYPYGGVRVSSSAPSNANELHKYIGQYFDATTDLNYLQATYYDGSKGELNNVSGKYSGTLPGVTAQDVATYIGPATATSTQFVVLIVVLTPDGCARRLLSHRLLRCNKRMTPDQLTGQDRFDIPKI